MRMTTLSPEVSAPAPGIVIIDKPGGITSHGVVAVTRRTLGTRKVGHAGTLDPMATGVLILGIGSATRLLGHLALRDKEYLATIRLGAATSTDDSEGEVLHRAEVDAVAALTDARIRGVVAGYAGVISQVPSSISAIKVDGERAYARVRAGEEVALKPRTVTVSAFDVLDVARASGFIDVQVRVECSTGTYIRALARDIGRDLDVGGHLTALRRTRVGPFRVQDAVELEAWSASADPSSALVPLADVARSAFTCRVVDAARADDIRNGRRIPWPEIPTAADATDHGVQVVALMDEAGELLALAEEREGRASYLCVFKPASTPA